MIPDFVKFLMEARAQQSDDVKPKLKKYSKYQLSEHFSQNKLDCWEQLMGILNTTAEQWWRIIEHREKLQDRYTLLIKNILKKKEEIFEEAVLLEESTVDHFRSTLDEE